MGLCSMLHSITFIFMQLVPHGPFITLYSYIKVARDICNKVVLVNLLFPNQVKVGLEYILRGSLHIQIEE